VSLPAKSSTLTRFPNIASAKLPATYERAKEALATCQRIDECKDWADKAAALASYAKQADDDSLQKCALRIQSRAIRRCGELLETFRSPGARTDREPRGGAPMRLTQRQAAAEAGMSKDQEVQAVRVAKLPEDVFEASVENDDPPTVTKLAEMGTSHQPEPPTEPVAIYTQESTYVLGMIRELATFCEAHDATAVAHAVFPQEVKKMRERVATVDAWLASFLGELPAAPC
jgi:hypothetical protein